MYLHVFTFGIKIKYCTILPSYLLLLIHGHAKALKTGHSVDAIYW